MSSSYIASPGPRLYFSGILPLSGCAPRLSLRKMMMRSLDVRLLFDAGKGLLSRSFCSG